VNTYLFTEQMMILAGLALVALPIMALGGSNVMNKGTGIEGAAAWGLVYVGVAFSVLGVAWRLMSGMLNLISGFIPFT